MSAKEESDGQKNPREFLQSVLGKPVQVILNSGVTYKGILACLDGFMVCIYMG